MSACCVTGCKNRHTFSCKLRFYRIPSQTHPFHANRRKLWLEALQKVNGNTDELRGNARVCGAHFISGEASMDRDNPDFVPSVFTCAKQNVSAKRGRWYYGRRKRRRRTANEEIDKTLTPPRVESPVEFQSLLSTDEILTPSVPQEEETMEEDVHVETMIKSPSSSPDKASSSSKASAGIQALDNRLPVVLLKPVLTAAGGYRCESCSQNFTDPSLLVKHIRTHEEKETSFMCEKCAKLFTCQTDFEMHLCLQETLFPCNMCNRSFPTSQNLKRHKLTHVKDSRKCRKCGVLFCRQHDHVTIQVKTEPEEDISISTPGDGDSRVMPQSKPLEHPEPIQTLCFEDNKIFKVRTPVPMSIKSSVPLLPVKPEPSPQPIKPLLSLPQPKKYADRGLPVLLRSPSLLVPRYSMDPGPSCKVEPSTSDPEDFTPSEHVKLPPSLEMFSPKLLTSAFIQVTRNYRYILGNPRDRAAMTAVKIESTFKRPLTLPPERRVKRIKKERTAYDMEIVL